MKKTVVIFFSLALSNTNLQSMSLADHEVPFSSSYQEGPQGIEVPHFYGRHLVEKLDMSLAAISAIEAINAHGPLMPDLYRKIDSKLGWARQLIAHGHDTVQIRGLNIKKKEHFFLPEALAIQLLQLKIHGIDDEGRLDKRLTVLSHFLVENPLAHEIVPLLSYEDETTQMVPEPKLPLKRALFCNNDEE